MPRTARLLIDDDPTVYHVISRTALPGFPFEDEEKDFLVNLLKRLSRVYFAEILGYCVMGNHMHILVRMLPRADISDAEIKKRFNDCYSNEQQLTDGQIPFYRAKWCSLSEFMKDVKQSFSRFYNKKHGRKGYLWAERFKSVIVENGGTLINCLAYIDLNPVRAGIGERPEEYRWSSLGYHAQTGNKGNFLSLDFGLKEFGKMSREERFRRYREFVYQVGALDKEKGMQIDEKVLEKEREKRFNLSRVERFRYRTRYFTDSGIIGSKAFVQKNFQRFKGLFQTVNDRVPKRVSGLEGIYSMKRLA